ncbi:MAG: 2'-5' RNA ligase family protein [Anaerolineales bacterium]|jgi:2'-5' RNA ligase
MTGIVTLLSDQYKDLLESIWHELKLECGLTGFEFRPYPHFSWQVADDYDFTRLDPILCKVAADAQPFSVKIAGFGVFSGEKPILYLSLVKDSWLFRFHELIWYAAYEFGVGINPLYAPQNWMPHITLMSDELDRSKMDCVMEHLVYRPFEMEIEVDNLSTITQQGEQAYIQPITYKLGG